MNGLVSNKIYSVNLQNIFLGFVLSFFISGCDINSTKLLKKDFLDTKLGTIKDKKLITKLPKPKVVRLKKIEIIIEDEPQIDLTYIPKNVKEKKQRFKEILVPIVQLVYKRLEQQYQDVKKDIENNSNQEFITLLQKEYKAKTPQKLLYALKPHPVSIVLAQAAIESAWLTSRFTKEANNIFGVWSFNKNEPRIPASSTRGSKTIYLKKYKTLKVSVEDYYKNLAKNWAYDKFRKERTLTNDPYKLVEYLGHYSEKREQYVKLLKKMIKYNKFDKYDIKEK